ncbi:MAG: hypothetical protein KF841_11670 [Phycisphaerae bacterium]|nr:hypothetical protein [Phycisphaerae bacterium]
MNRTPTHIPMKGRLAELPAALKLLLSIFLAIVGGGYIVAVANIYYSHAMADGRPGLSMDDIRAVYSGIELSRTTADAVPSRMLTMLRGAMRQYVEDDADFDTLESWLKAGGTPDGLEQGEPGKTPNRAIIRNCLRCHARSSGEEIAARAPFGTDELTVDWDMMKPLLASVESQTVERARLAPQYNLPRLILVSHVHMLSIPMFTLIVGLAFSMTRFPNRAAAWLIPMPMCALVLDFAGWWLSRLGDPFVFLIAAGGGLFGLAFGIQIVVTLFDLWWPIRRIMETRS